MVIHCRWRGRSIMTESRVSWVQMSFTCAVVSILVQLVACSTLAAVPSRLIGAVVCTVAVVHGALINICKQGNSSRVSAVCPSAVGISKYWHKHPSQQAPELETPTKTRAAISIEALVALAEVGANDVAAASLGVAPVTACRTLVLIWEGRAHTPRFWSGEYYSTRDHFWRTAELIACLRSACCFHGNLVGKRTCSFRSCSHTQPDRHTPQASPHIRPHLGRRRGQRPHTEVFHVSSNCFFTPTDSSKSQTLI